MKIEVGKKYKTVSGLIVDIVGEFQSKYIGKVGPSNLTIYYCQNGRANTVSEEYDIVEYCHESEHE